MTNSLAMVGKRESYKMFQTKEPKDDGKYQWTNHVKDKMRFYRISESLLKRVVRFPKRVEEGIAPGTTAVMQPRVVNGKTKEEIWVMYTEVGKKPTSSSKKQVVSSKLNTKYEILNTSRRRIISAWRYPGTSPIRGPIPIPEDILIEIENIT